MFNKIKNFFKKYILYKKNKIENDEKKKRKKKQAKQKSRLL